MGSADNAVVIICLPPPPPPALTAAAPASSDAAATATAAVELAVHELEQTRRRGRVREYVASHGGGAAASRPCAGVVGIVAGVSKAQTRPRARARLAAAPSRTAGGAAAQSAPRTRVVHVGRAGPCASACASSGSTIVVGGTDDAATSAPPSPKRRSPR